MSTVFASGVTPKFDVSTTDTVHDDVTCGTLVCGTTIDSFLQTHASKTIEEERNI
jgi:hypothetical protein